MADESSSSGQSGNVLSAPAQKNLTITKWGWVGIGVAVVVLLIIIIVIVAVVTSGGGISTTGSSTNNESLDSTPDESLDSTPDESLDSTPDESLDGGTTSTAVLVGDAIQLKMQNPFDSTQTLYLSAVATYLSAGTVPTTFYVTEIAGDTAAGNEVQQSSTKFLLANKLSSDAAFVLLDSSSSCSFKMSPAFSTALYFQPKTFIPPLTDSTVQYGSTYALSPSGNGQCAAGLAINIGTAKGVLSTTQNQSLSNQYMWTVQRG
jgi:hypothetical protein